MNRSSLSLQFLAASMSSHSPYRGGRHQWRRVFSDRTSGDERDQFVTGDSHFRSVREANLGFRPEERENFANRGAFRPQPPPHFYPGPGFNPPPQFHLNFNRNQQFGPPMGPPPDWTRNQQFRPPRQQFRSRPSKPLDYRNWEYAQPGPAPHCERFTVLSYNILADYLAVNHRSKLYFHIPRHILDWEWRKRSIIFELGLWSADIMCFQEVDRFQDLEEELKLRGYNGIWKMRTGDPVDGCAIFWRISRFKLLHEECIEFNKLGLRDNVAQICVLELVNQNGDKFTSVIPASSRGPNRVVICNIHVLYNPKRGDIKLGQIRVLLERANAASKLWDDAPVVLCGDFNGTPKSPLYNYISEQKLNLSELPRDKVSGQYSAEIRAPRQFSPFPGPQAAQNSVQAPIIVNNLAVKNSDSLLNVHKQSAPDGNVKNEPSMTSSFPPQCINPAVDASDQFILDELAKETYKDSITSCKDESEMTVDVPYSSLKESPSSSDRETGLPDDERSMEIHEATNVETSDTSSELILETTSLSVADEKSSPSRSCNDSVSYDLTNVSFVVDEKVGNLSSNEFVEVTKEEENLGEDCATFLSELHDTDSTLFASDFSGSVRSDSLEPHESMDDEVLDDASLGIDSLPVGELRTTYNPSAWTPMEIETATGKADCTLMEHPLKLTSAYSEVEDRSGARDSNGEPLVTSYHRLFLGTVDYIWRSEGLQTVRVLAPIPKHAMQWTPGFPTKKWGSDHIALVSELAFTENASSQNTEAE